MHGSFGLCTSAPGGELFLTIGYDRRDRSRFADGDIDVVSLLLPAWRAAHHTLATYGARWAALAATIDAAPEALLVVGADGRERHRSAALRRELAAEPERDRLVAAMLAMAADLAALRRAGPGAATPHAAAARADASRTVVTALGRYTLHAAFAPPLLWGIDDAIHVTVAAAGRDAAPLAAAADGPLTAREREVARLLARRATNAEVAAALGLSGHTARRHTERVLQKLGVRSRTAVATALAAVEG
jgi:DNA-binding CsgD family transcriptional regulator